MINLVSSFFKIIISGMKPGQRKVLFTCFKRNDKREVKVAQLAGSVAELSAYHHGEVSDQLFFSLFHQNKTFFTFFGPKPGQFKSLWIFLLPVIIHWL